MDLIETESEPKNLTASQEESDIDEDVDSSEARRALKRELKCKSKCRPLESPRSENDDQCVSIW